MAFFNGKMQVEWHILSKRKIINMGHKYEIMAWGIVVIVTVLKH